ncbi:hypothetical protein ACEQPO_06320 [Bacillus sp. SL00103]
MKRNSLQHADVLDQADALVELIFFLQDNTVTSCLTYSGLAAI